MVTFSHFTSPRWFATLGGWESDGSVDLFARYAERAAKHLGDLISYAVTFNEPNVLMLLTWMNFDIQAGSMVEKDAHAVGSDRFGSFFLGHREKIRGRMMAAHHRGFTALKSGPVSIRLESLSL